MKTKVNDELKKHFRPEFLNRIDDIIVFHQLTEEQIITMVDLMITRVEAALANKDMAIELTPAAKSLLARRGFDPVLGARPLRRLGEWSYAIYMIHIPLMQTLFLLLMARVTEPCVMSVAALAIVASRPATPGFPVVPAPRTA